MPKPRFYYGWVVAASCAIVILVANGINFSFSVFVTSLQAEFGWTRAMTSGIFSLYLLFAGVFGIIQGQALDRFGPRVVIPIMGCVTGAGLFLIARAQSPLQLYFSYSVLLSMGTGSMYILVISITSHWFDNHRSTLVGIIGSTSGLGTVIISPMAAWLIAVYHWREAFFILGICSVTIIVPLGLLLKRRSPGSGLTDDYPRQTDQGNGHCESGQENYSLPMAIRSRSFWLMFTVWIFHSFCLHMILGHVVPMAEDMGIAPIPAAAILSVMTAVFVPLRVVSGILSDRRSKKLLFVMCFLAMILSVMWLLNADRLWMLYVFAAGYGAAWGSLDPPMFALISDAFGMQKMASITGLLMLGWGMGSALGPWAGGMIYDQTGDYRLAFMVAGLALVLAAGCAWRFRATPRG